MTDIITQYETFQREKMKIIPIWRQIPKYMHEGIAAHVMQGRRTGSFLHAIFTNNLEEAVGHADPTNLRLLKEYVHFMYIHFPYGSYGSPEAVKAWQKSGGILGQEATGTAKPTFSDWTDDANS